MSPDGWGDFYMGSTTMRRELPPDLGYLPDAVIARREGISRERVRQLRARAGIRSYRSLRRAFPEIPPLGLDGEIGNLGKESDKSIAKRRGVPTQRVRTWRCALSIPAFRYIKGHPASDEYRAAAKELGQFSCRELADKTGRSLPSARGWVLRRGRPSYSPKHKHHPTIRRIGHALYEWCGE